MKDRITLNGRNGAFGAYIAHPVGGCSPTGGRTIF
jgi:hypothetical protein